MSRRLHVFSLATASVVTTLVVGAQSQTRPQQPTRDTPAQQTAQTQTPAPAGRIAGRVLSLDTGRPVTRARVFINAAEVPGGRGAATDNDGVYEFTQLPAGRYTVAVSKTGYVSLSYGQRRPLQAGTPLQLADGQQLTGVDFRLPRGSAIAGHVVDERGDPLPGATVRVLRYQYAQGNRQLVPAGGGQTDDQGAYRVWGLNPGDYYVSATSRNFDVGGRGFGGQGPGGPPPGGPGPGPTGGGRGGRGGAFAGGDVALQGRAGAPANAQLESVGYAPTFYPGVPSADAARPVTVGLSAEVLNIDFGVLLVRTGTISGRAVRSDGAPVVNGNVALLPETGGGGPGFADASGARIQRDGSFAIPNVAPGRYVLRARAGDANNGTPQWAMQPLVVSDGDLRDVNIVLEPGATITGTVTYQTTQTAAPNPGQVRIAAPTPDFVNLGPNPVARIGNDGTFAIDGVSAGQHLIRLQNGIRGWSLKSVTLGGRDIIDTPIDLKSGQTLAGVTLIFTDRLTSVSGTLTDNNGTPITEYTVLAFPSDPSLWRPQARQIMTARPDQNGKYQIQGLPPGDYLIAAVDPTEQGEWFEPAFLEQQRPGAQHLTLSEGDVKTEDFKLAAR